MASGSNSIVEDWLRSVDLVQYTQSFLDNGYDDLEVCKQIGEDDLDAIGVPRDEHREKLLRAVKVLREEGGTAVYFTLEECDTCQSGDETEVGDLHDDDPCLSSVCGNGARRGKSYGAVRLDAYDMGKTTLVTFPKVQLKLILRDKLVEDNIDLAGPPFTTSDQSVCGSSLTALAIRFAEELKTHFIDVLERLEELWIVARNNESLCSQQSLCRSPARGVYGGPQSIHYGYPPQYYQHIYPYPGSPRSQPPPLPSCPPPPTMSSNCMDRCSSLQSHLDGGHLRLDPTAHQNYVALDGDSGGAHEDKKKSGSVFGRFLRNIGFRRSSRKGTYKQHQGDLNAYEISMSDEDRMALMILVKEGKISTQTALAVVQKFEEERRAVVRVSEEGKENVFNDTPTKKVGKKKKGGKPTKSQSTLSADDPQRCDICPPKSPADDHLACDHQICRQRRVHSLGQLDVPHLRLQHEPQHDHQMERVALTRAVSCTPACPQNQKMTYAVDQSSLVNRLHSPGHPHQLLQQQPSHHHHNLNKVEALRERLTGKTITIVPKTSSKTSLLSSGSDQSMECGSQTPLRTDPMSRRGADTYNSNSTVSMSSDNNSPGLSRKKSGPMLDPRIKSHRSASCSTGDDGISSENDDNDSNSKRQQDTAKGKHPSVNKKCPRTKEATLSKPPLLRQLSAPVGASNSPGPYLGQAKVIVDYSPSVDEEDFVALKKGELVNIINMAQSGVWLGVVNGKRGKFRFEHVEVVTEPDKASICSQLLSGQKDIPKSVEDLLQRIGLGQLSNTFLLNGYDDLDIFSELDGHDLDTLHITEQDHRTKLLSAARVLVDWHEQCGTHTPTLTNMDSPSSRAGNSSCDSGCYASGEGTKHHSRRRGDGGHRKPEEDNCIARKAHTPCRSCGKPKQPKKYSIPANNTGTGHYMPGQYPSLHSPYSPGHFQYVGHQFGPYNPGYYGYHTSGHGHHGHHHQQYAMSGSRTLTELNASESPNFPVKLETFSSAKQNSNVASPVQGSVMYADKKPAIGERVSLTEEDKEVISITCGNNQSKKLSTPIQTLNSGSSQLDITSNTQYSGCIPLTGCPQCDESFICESASCIQCATYASCPQCFPYRHYVNTTMRSDSKSSKMSCSSTCTQTTCLSPDHDDSSHSGGSNLLDYSLNSPSGYSLSKASPNRVQPFYYYQQQYTQPAFGHAIVHLTERATTPSQLPSAPAPKSQPTPPPLTLALAEPNLTQGVALTLQTEPQPPLMTQPDWSSQSESTEAPGIATLYSRARSQTPEKSEKSSGQLKSPTRSLMPLVSTKLSAERIDLTQTPYSTTIGHCGIPPLLVQRYSEELRQDMETMSMVIEQLRESQLRALGRPCIQNEALSETCKQACDLQISSVQNFLISIGLPMYFKPLTDNSVTTLDQMLKLKDGELEKITGADSRHLKRICHALEWVQHKLSSPNHKPLVGGVTDKV
ncbi:uncharacterized protein LOC106057893 isoform X3 [Biomphalaria glabrata]|uniref:Sterile alpha motif domain-containing protein 5 n=1 Tax=Biomphalaria glabrata TaxID=6526 RepID=A0A9W3AKW1_BIOGL|nr:uncharacterized protein LOC106057893 isoform X3 [Biomphalaria glabrata]